MMFPLSEVDRYAETTSFFQGRKNSGPGFSLEGGLLVGAQTSNYKAPFSFNVLGNYTISTRNIVSLGSGVEFLGVSFAPVFMEYKYLLSDKRVSPYLFGRLGKMFHLSRDYSTDYNNDPYGKSDYKGGLSFAVGTGVSWSKEDVEPYLSFAYRYAETSYKQTDYNSHPATYKSNYNRLEIKFGFKF
jgi:hypothetical protein